MCIQVELTDCWQNVGKVLARITTKLAKIKKRDVTKHDTPLSIIL